MSFLDICRAQGLRGCLAHGGKFTNWCGLNEEQGQWSGLRGGRDQNMKAKLNSEPWTRITNSDLSSKPLLAISNRDRMKTGLGKKKNVLAEYWNTILPSHRKRKNSFVPTGKSEPDILSQVCLSYMSVLSVTLLSSPPNRLPLCTREQGYQQLLCLPPSSFHPPAPERELSTLLHAADLKVLGEKGSVLHVLLEFQGHLRATSINYDSHKMELPWSSSQKRLAQHDNLYSNPMVSLEEKKIQEDGTHHRSERPWQTNILFSSYSSLATKGSYIHHLILFVIQKNKKS